MTLITIASFMSCINPSLVHSSPCIFYRKDLYETLSVETCLLEGYEKYVLGKDLCKTERMWNIPKQYTCIW